MPTYIPNHKQQAIDRAAWPERYASVRDAIALGFWPDAYGMTIGREIHCAPPLKFAYPAGGIAHPHHADGVAAGSYFWIWRFDDQNRSPDELRDSPGWLCGPTNVCDGPWGMYPIRGGLTLDEAFAHVIACAAHYRRYCIVPDPDSWPTPRLLTREWRELVDLCPVPPGTQLGLFDDPIQGPFAPCRRAIRDALRPLADDEPQALPANLYDLYVIELIHSANRRRRDAGLIPEFELEHQEREAA